MEQVDKLYLLNRIDKDILEEALMVGRVDIAVLAQAAIEERNVQIASLSEHQ